MSTLHEMAEICRPLSHPKPYSTLQGTLGSPDYVGVTARWPDYAHCRWEGICGPAVTVADLERLIYCRYFGGRDAWISAGVIESSGPYSGLRMWRATEHTD